MAYFYFGISGFIYVLQAPMINIERRADADKKIISAADVVIRLMRAFISPHDIDDTAILRYAYRHVSHFNAAFQHYYEGAAAPPCFSLWPSGNRRRHADGLDDVISLDAFHFTGHRALTLASRFSTSARLLDIADTAFYALPGATPPDEFRPPKELR